MLERLDDLLAHLGEEILYVSLGERPFGCGLLYRINGAFAEFRFSTEQREDIHFDVVEVGRQMAISLSEPLLDQSRDTDQTVDVAPAVAEGIRAVLEKRR
ncbi:hypothetical protein [Caballeronia sp.]|uniref:hypothetical protein n=1 Tax=Caballeronia sp. TaxID=1931223 RepID=UPI003C600C7D